MYHKMDAAINESNQKKALRTRKERQSMVSNGESEEGDAGISSFCPQYTATLSHNPTLPGYKDDHKLGFACESEKDNLIRAEVVSSSVSTQLCLSPSSYTHTHTYIHSFIHACTYTQTITHYTTHTVCSCINFKNNKHAKNEQPFRCRMLRRGIQTTESPSSLFLLERSCLLKERRCFEPKRASSCGRKQCVFVQLPNNAGQ